MYVIGHNHITHQQKLVPFANRSQRAHKHVSRANRSQQRQPTVTTEGDKVQIAAAVIAFQILGHERPPQEPTCNPDTWGTQSTQSRRMLTLLTAQWYPPVMHSAAQGKSGISSGPPAKISRRLRNPSLSKLPLVLVTHTTRKSGRPKPGLVRRRRVALRFRRNLSKLSRSASIGGEAGQKGAKVGESIAIEQTVMTVTGSTITGAEKPEITRTDSSGVFGGNIESSSDKTGIGFELPAGDLPVVGGVDVESNKEGLSAFKDAGKELQDSLRNP